MRRKQQK